MEAQTWRQRSGASGVLDGEARDNVGEQRVRQAALVGLVFTDDGAGGGRNEAFCRRGDELGGDVGEDHFHDTTVPHGGHRCGPPDRRTERVLVGEAWDWSIGGDGVDGAVVTNIVPRGCLTRALDL